MASTMCHINLEPLLKMDLFEEKMSSYQVTNVRQTALDKRTN